MPTRDNRNRNLNGQSVENQGSQALNQYSRNLGDVANQLKVAADSFDSTAKELQRSNDELVSTLRKFADAFDKDLGDQIEKSNKQSKENTTNLTNSWNRATRDIDGQLTKGQKIGQALIATAKTAFTFVFNNFKQSFSKVLNNYNDNFESITSRMQWSAQQYSDMLYRATDRIKDEKLRFEFSQVDLSNALIPVLETGIRGGLAEEMAYRNMIMNRVLPMINTNTRQYTRMSKIFGKSFTDGIQAIGTYTQQYLQSAEGLEEGGYDTAIQTIYREIQDQVRLEGGSAEDVTSRMTEVLGAYSTAAANFGKDYAEKAIADYSAYLRGESVMQGNLEALLPGINAKDTSFASYLGAQQNLITEYMSKGKSSYFAEAFGFDVTVIQDVLNGLYFTNKEDLKSTEEMMLGYNKDAQNKKVMDNLTKGYYQSVTEQMDNFNENLTAKFATFIGQNVPHAESVLEGIISLLQVWLPAIFSSSSSGGLFGKNDSGLLAKLGGGAAGSVAAKSVAGVGGFLAGTVLTGYDVYQELSQGKGVGSAALSGLLTGRGLMTSEQERSNLQKALSGEHVSFDLGDAFLNAAKGAGIGAGIGTAAGGWAAGSGTVIGTVAGAVGGFFSNAIQQWIEDAKFNKFADALNNATNAINELSSSSDEYISAQQKEIYFTQAYNKIQGGDLKGGIADLVKIFPEYQEGIEKITGKNDEYLEILKQSVEYESRKSEYQLSKDLLDAANKLKNAVGTPLEGITGGKSSVLMGEANKYLTLLGGHVEGGVTTQSDIESDKGFQSSFRKQYEQYISAQKLTPEQFTIDQYVDALNKQFGHTIIRKGSSGAFIPNYNYRTGMVLATPASKFSEEQIQAQAEQEIDKFESAFDTVQAQYESALSLIPTLEQVVYDENGNPRAIDEVKQILGGDTFTYRNDKEAFEALSEGLTTAASRAKSLGGAAKNSWESWTQGINLQKFDPYYKAFDVSVPQLHRGIAYVPFDNYPALLHKGEAVIPATPAGNLRSLAGSDTIEGISEYLTRTLEAQTAGTMASPIADTTMFDSLTSAIETQTSTLSLILESILDRVVNIVSIMDGASRRQSVNNSIPQSILSYDGVPLKV